MKNIFFYILFLFSFIGNSQGIVINVDEKPNYKRMVKKAKTHLLLSNMAQVELKVEFWKDKMPTTDKQSKDYIQFNVSMFASAGSVNVVPKKVYFLYYMGRSSKPSQVVIYSFTNGDWVPEDPKIKMQSAPGKVLVEFEDIESKKIQIIKNEGPFVVEQVS